MYRIYRKLELNLRIQPKKRLIREVPDKLVEPKGINDTWSMDFMHDQLYRWPELVSFQPDR